VRISSWSIHKTTRERIVKQIESGELKNERGLSHHAIFPPKMNACCAGAQKACGTQVHDAQRLDDRCDCQCDFEAERWDGMS